MKRLRDILLAILTVTMTCPVMLFAAILVRLDSSGAIFFRQKRVGKNGKIFDILKFRTMVENAEALGPSITPRNDPRITQIGRLLRWLKIDELPQLFNVLKGEMSFVGPRPEVPHIVATYNEEQREVLSVKPGLLGPSQITNRDEEAQLPEREDVESFYIQKILPQKLERDLIYVRSKTPFKDLRILFGGGFRVILSSFKLSYILESRRRFFFLIFDILISFLSLFGAFMLRFEGQISPKEYEFLIKTLPFVFLLRAPIFIYFGLYQTLWQYLGIQELFAIVKAVTAGSLLLPIAGAFLWTSLFPRSVLIIDWVLLLTALGAARIFYKITADRLKMPRFDNRKNVLILGAGDAGEFFVREFIRKPELGYMPVGFLDDDPQKAGVRIHGVKVFGKISQLSQVLKVRKAEEVVIAIPHLSGEEVKKIAQICQKLQLICRVMPQTATILSPQAAPLKLRAVDISDLLGRDLVTVDIPGIQSFIRGKKVLITGGGGSIGSELARIIHEMHPKEMILIDNVESNLYEIQMHLQAHATETNVVYYLRDVGNGEDIEKIFESHRPQIIYHAAAYKHVPMVEMNYREGILNNVLGTKTVADLSRKYEAECFILISTDKAICPQSIMGATKRIGEIYLQGLPRTRTRFHAVRFGNVFNSRGSVIPLFKKQLEEGLPLTITDPEVKRYFMDLSEAVFLILQATILGVNSEIFMLDMGRSIKIVDLAKELATMMGVDSKNLKMNFIGLRPGEKLEEQLELHNESLIPTAHKKIRIWKMGSAQPEEAGRFIEELIELVRKDAPLSQIKMKLKQIIPEYQPWPHGLTL